jgi:hypothetical protein
MKHAIPVYLCCYSGDELTFFYIGECKPCASDFKKITRNSRASAILAEPSCAVQDKKHSGCRKGLSRC